MEVRSGETKREPHPRARKPRAGVTPAILVVSAACGGDGSATSGWATGAVTDETVARNAFESSVTPSDRVFAVECLKAARLKFGKRYDITGLPGATAATLMSFEQKDIEVRFLPSHETPVSQGIPVAREIFGPDAELTGGRLPWDYGITDERACQPGNLGGGHDCTRQPKYADFVTHGSFIMFCEGREPAEGARAVRRSLSCFRSDANLSPALRGLS